MMKYSKNNKSMVMKLILLYNVLSALLIESVDCGNVERIDGEYAGGLIAAEKGIEHADSGTCMFLCFDPECGFGMDIVMSTCDDARAHQ